jgi:hypothetical protein
MHRTERHDRGPRDLSDFLGQGPPPRQSGQPDGIALTHTVQQGA